MFFKYLSRIKKLAYYCSILICLACLWGCSERTGTIVGYTYISVNKPEEVDAISDISHQIKINENSSIKIESGLISKSTEKMSVQLLLKFSGRFSDAPPSDVLKTKISELLKNDYRIEKIKFSKFSFRD